MIQGKIQIRAIVSGCAALLLCTVSGFSLAQTTDINPLLSSAPSWDLNGDGIYTCDEWKVFVNKIFDRADKNHDGHVDAHRAFLGRVFYGMIFFGSSTPN